LMEAFISSLKGDVLDATRLSVLQSLVVLKHLSPETKILHTISL
jgi:hypothetical protein